MNESSSQLQRNPFRFSFEIGLFVLFFSFGLGFQGFRNYADTQRFVEHTHSSIRTANTIHARFLSLSVLFKAYLISDDPAKLERFNQEEARLMDDINELQQLNDLVAEKNHVQILSLAKVHSLAREYVQFLKNALPQDHRHFLTLLQTTAQQEANLNDKTIFAIKELKQSQRQELNKSLADANRNLGLALVTALISALLSIFFLITSKMALTFSHRQLENHAHKLIQANLSAQQAKAAKSAFLANLSHEVRTPISTILGISEMLAGQRLTADQRDSLLVVRTSSQNLLKLLNELLDLDKIEAGKFRLTKSSFNLEANVKDVVELLKPTAASDLQIDILMSAEVPKVIHTDLGRFNQILANLIGNAIEICGSSGRILVQIQTVSKPDSPTSEQKFNGQAEVHTEQSSGGPFLQISIEASGLGIQNKNVSSQFEPWSGSGLANTRAIVHALGGDISALKKSDGGTCFWLTIAAQNPSDTAHQAPMLKIEESVRTRHDLISVPLSGKVLVVDELGANLTIIQMMLEKLGLHVTASSSTSRALSLLKSEAFDLAFLNLRVSDQIQELGGASIASEFRKFEQLQQLHTNTTSRKPLPLIAMTTPQIDPSQHTQLPHGFTDHISKPFIFDRLAVVCQRQLQLMPYPSTDLNKIASAAPEHQI